MVALIVFALFMGGSSYLVTESAVFAPLRLGLSKLPWIGSVFRLLLYCPMCVAFWIGLGLGSVEFCEPLTYSGDLGLSIMVHSFSGIAVARLWNTYVSSPLGFLVESGTLISTKEAPDASTTQETENGQE